MLFLLQKLDLAKQEIHALKASAGSDSPSRAWSDAALQGATSLVDIADLASPPEIQAIAPTQVDIANLASPPEMQAIAPTRAAALSCPSAALPLAPSACQGSNSVPRHSTAISSAGESVPGHSSAGESGRV